MLGCGKSEAFPLGSSRRVDTWVYVHSSFWPAVMHRILMGQRAGDEEILISTQELPSCNASCFMKETLIQQELERSVKSQPVPLPGEETPCFPLRSLLLSCGPQLHCSRTSACPDVTPNPTGLHRNTRN